MKKKTIGEDIKNKHKFVKKKGIFKKSNLNKLFESIKKRINDEKEMVIIVNGKEGCGMSSMAMDIGECLSRR